MGGGKGKFPGIRKIKKDWVGNRGEGTGDVDLSKESRGNGEEREVRMLGLREREGREAP